MRFNRWTKNGVPERVVTALQTEWQTHDYYRRGTTLFAVPDVLTGNVMGTCMKKHTVGEYISFLKTIDVGYLRKKVLHIIADNYVTHKTKEVRAYLESKRGRFVEHFIRKSGLIPRSSAPAQIT
jgi:hypothetical protein